MPGPFMSVQPRRAFSLQGPGTLASDLVYGYSGGWLTDRTVGPKLPVRYQLGTNSAVAGATAQVEKVATSSLPAPGPTDVWCRSASTVTLTFFISSLSSWQPLLFKGISTGRYWSLSVYTDGNIRLESAGYFGNSGLQTTVGGVITAGRWHTLTMTTSGFSAEMFVNGRSVASGPLGGMTQTDATEALLAGFGLPYGGSFTAATAVYISHLSVSYKELPLGRIRELALNPNSMFQGPKRNLRFLPDTNGAITVPGSDVAVSGWTSTPGPSFTPMVNEFVPDDGTYITSPFAGTGDPIILELGRPLEPGQWNVRFRANFVGSFASSVLVRLLDASNNVVGTAAAELLTGAMQTHTVAVDTTGTAYRVSLEAV